jgi:arylsulfatase A-like enzyme
VVETPLSTPDILPSLLSLTGVSIPDTIEGEDVSHLFRGDDDAPDRAPLIMSVAPFGTDDFKPYRGVRTARYTYVRDTDGPWLLYDNQADPYQMSNLVASPEHAGLRDELDAKLAAQLKRNGDAFPTADEALAKWGYTVGKGGAIPYCGEFRSQSPGPDKGVVCKF